jgi:hypothetical protein
MSRMQICRLSRRPEARRRPPAMACVATDLRSEAEQMLREMAFVYHLVGRGAKPLRQRVVTGQARMMNERNE